MKQSKYCTIFTGSERLIDMNLTHQKILVTGADGFIGSHLTEILLNMGCHVRALSLYNSFNDFGWLEVIPKNDNLEIVCGDARDPHFCEEITRNIDVIFHLAALIAIPYSYVAPDSYVDTNVKGTLNICQAAKQNGCERVIHTSTSEVYGTAQYVPIDEKHPLQPQSPYSASKIGADQIAMSFYSAFDTPIAIVRPFNTYGPRQSARAVIPTVITQIANGQRKIKLGALHPTRDFNYIKDTVKGFIAVAESEKTVGEIVNIGSNFEISIGETVDIIAEMMEAEIEIESDAVRLRPEKSEVERLWADNTKIRNLTDWEALYAGKDGLRRGLFETIEWFTNPENLKNYKADVYNI